jgi:hypothetical protein
MKALRFAALAMVLVCAAHARPVVFEESATLVRPDSSWSFFGRYGVAIDGDYALVSGDRVVDDASSPTGTRREVAAFLYRRSGTSWNHVGQLGPVATITNAVRPGLAMKQGLAMVITDRARIFQRSGTTWTEMALDPALATNLHGSEVVVDAGRIMAGRMVGDGTNCFMTSVILARPSGSWIIETSLGGSQIHCPSGPLQTYHDLHGDRAIVYNSPGWNGEPPSLQTFLRNANGNWELRASAQPGSIDIALGPEVAINDRLWANAGSPTRGTSIGYELDQPVGPVWGAWAHYGLQPADAFRQHPAYTIERYGARMFAERNFSYDRNTYVINLFRVNEDQVRSSDHVATLQGRSGGPIGDHIDVDGNRIIASGRANVRGDNTVRVFELPASFEAPAVQVHDFEAPADGALWQPTAGSSFSIVRVGNTSVYRQSDRSGQSAAYLPASPEGNQAIQAELTIRSVSGEDRWAGLFTRRTDDSNYYYVTLRTSGVLELRRMRNGSFTTLASTPANVVLGQKYWLRLQSIGGTHRVYLNDTPLLTARDSTLSAGTAGVITFRAATDFDNVVVTPSPLTTVDVEDFTYWPYWFEAWQGQWETVEGVYRQSYTGGFARAYTGALTEDQVIQARIRPTGFAEPDNWVGLMARYKDERNYLFVTLRGRNVISLWRRTDARIEQLATRAMEVTGDWYDVRLEVIANRTRVYVNGRLMLSSNADPGPVNPYLPDQRSQVGLITYGATADFDDVLTYQP